MTTENEALRDALRRIANYRGYGMYAMDGLRMIASHALESTPPAPAAAAVPEGQLFIVLNSAQTEGFVTDTESDAVYAATGKMPRTGGVPTVGESFYEAYVEDNGSVPVIAVPRALLASAPAAPAAAECRVALGARHGEAVAQIVSSGPANMPILQWLSADHSFRAPIGSKLYARTAAPTDQQIAPAAPAVETVPMHVGACITDGRLHVTIMQRLGGVVHVLATADMDVEALKTHDCHAIAAPQPSASGAQPDLAGIVLRAGAELGHHHTAWDTADPEALVAAVLKVAAHPAPTAARVDFLPYDDILRYVHRVLSADHPTREDRRRAAADVMRLRQSVRPAAQGEDEPVARLAQDPAGYLVVVADDAPTRPGLKPFPVYTRPSPVSQEDAAASGGKEQEGDRG